MEENEDDKIVSTIINYFSARVNIAKGSKFLQKYVWKIPVSVNFNDKSLSRNSNGSRHPLKLLIYSTRSVYFFQF